MAEPSKKAPALAQLLNSLTNRTEAIKLDKCVDPPIGCGGNASPETFRDNLSFQEYRISGLCQKCQDKVWPPDA